MIRQTTIVLMILLCTNLVIAVDNTQVDLVDIEQKQLIIQESAKTRAEVKQYIDKKSIDFKVQTEKAVDENFAVLDTRINGMVRDAGFKLGVIFFSSIVLGGALLILINRRIKRKSYIKSHSVDQVLREDQIIRTTENDPTEPPKKPVVQKKKKLSEMEELEKSLEPIDPLPDFPKDEMPDGRAGDEGFMPSFPKGDSY